MDAKDALKQYRDLLNETPEGRALLTEFKALSMSDRVELIWHMAGSVSRAFEQYVIYSGSEFPDSVSVRHTGDERDIN